ncbi:hypothetical protein [Halarcobacter bivalviorum]|uniref:Transglutaminase-like domain-containing protein n=1 Tax=Halarcobacter bivalviorum TaxID=663364 RepID=A0AAX2A6V9_9BACT|nr:hypothetical protein [Halarcobacter bivalviorum]AXH13413.1 hypothetical protein ABIV_2442 [Halarcobacter bivalviorum]RXK09987.1 hypothetical protein CRV05_06285 [Halarcobacter bivalviorum]
MLFESKLVNKIALIVTVIFFAILISFLFKSFFIVKNQFINIDGATYVNQVRQDDYTFRLGNFLTKNCLKDELCEVQSMLDFVTRIPYKVNKSVARSPKHVVEQNFGDCDDKSNLLISLLKTKGYEAYFVFVPKHVFVIVKLKEKLANKKALYVNGQAFYKLETTATNSKIGFPLKYKLEEIEAIIDPFRNKKLVVESLEYK